MSRAKIVDNSTTVSLFPFLAVLLCTMGALLVVLVAVSRSAHDAALRKAATAQATAVADDDPAARAELEKVDQYLAKLMQVRAEAEKKLREDQLRLGQLENHMRRLQDQLKALQFAAAELDAMEEEHYDDRKQAEREVERLKRLIEESQAAIGSLKNESKSPKRTYALVPYEGPNGTFRRPIYIECRKDELVLQPEGVRISRSDLQPPLGSGNALAAALRAARDHFVRSNPGEGQNRDSEPYPMILIRPEGADLFGAARSAVEAADFDFGFEPVESHWDLNYGAADPQLAGVEQQAVDQARIRQRALALAAPRAYRNPALAATGRFEFGDDAGGGSGFSDIVGSDDDGDGDERAGTSSPPAGENTNGRPNPQPNDIESGPSSATNADSSGRSGTEPNGENAIAAGATAATAAPSQTEAAGTAGNNSASAADINSSPQVAATIGGPEQAPADESQQTMNAAARGKDWALKGKKANAVAIRRTIQVVVRDDRVAILPDDARSKRTAVEGKAIALKGDTVESLDQFVAAIRQHIEGWGMAGDGLYWRPVLLIQVGPDGQRRADDLVRLLGNSGFELRSGGVPTNNSQGTTRATR